ncbi:hypothetical protein BDD12DRAFT_877934 [Trichophaea hybrida]|nr:hypothetical protein BDD12DRAFT_877934 [Trichophaea hybrida]
MELYNAPAESKYITGLTQWFQMPRDNGQTSTALAISKKQGDNLNSGYTILITLLFAAIGKILVPLIGVALLPLQDNGNRHAILVAFLNTGDPISALSVMVKYQWKLLFKIKITCKHRDWRTFWRVTLLCLVQFAILATSTAAGIVIPVKLLMGNMARVNPSAIFYPSILATNSTALQREANDRLVRAAAFRAIGTVEFLEDVLGKEIQFGENILQVGADGQPEISFDYSYNLTGIDFGLQRAPGLRHTASGHCQTEYTWHQDSSNSTHDIYWLWGNSSMERIVPIPGGGNYSPPRANFETPPSNIADAKSTGSVRFSILPYTAGRRSRVEFNQTQPWYVTEDLYDPITNSRYVVKAKRPAISCYHNTSWHYGKSMVNSTPNLDKLVQNGLKVAPFWLNTVFIREFTSVPPIVTMSRGLGYSNLASFSEGFSIANRVENSAANLQNDLKYLVMGSFIYSREVIRNTVMLSPNREGLINAAEVNGVVPDETADFVLESPDIQTISCKWLIMTPALTLVAWLIALNLHNILSIMPHIFNKLFIDKFTSRTVGFSAVQLYRYLDEQLSGQRRWDGRLSSAPYIGLVDLEKKNGGENGCLSEGQKVSVPVSAQYPASGVVDLKLRSTVMGYDNENSDYKESKYAAPKLFRLYPCSGPAAAASSNSAQVLAEIKETKTPIITTEASPPDEKYELAMTTTWDPRHNCENIWKSVCENSKGKFVE